MNIKPAFRIGKSGLESSVLEAIDSYLRKHKVCKVRVLCAERDQVKEYAEKAAEFAKGSVTQIRGFTFTLQK